MLRRKTQCTNWKHSRTLKWKVRSTNWKHSDFVTIIKWLSQDGFLLCLWIFQIGKACFVIHFLLNMFLVKFGLSTSIWIPEHNFFTYMKIKVNVFHTGFNFSVDKFNFTIISQNSRIQEVISRVTGLTLGLFVLISMHFSC